MRLDLFLVEQGFVSTRSQASDLIRRKLVTVDGKIAEKTGIDIVSQEVMLLESSRFVSRAGEKLAQALVDFQISLHDKIAIDVGSSTGGFTDCAIQHGIRFVYAYDVGTLQMDPSLRHHPKVQLHEETNILSVALPKADIVFIDVSFTSIKPILTHFMGFQGEMICLIKPQFESGPQSLKHGILKDIKRTKAVLLDVLSHAQVLGFAIRGLARSSLKGKSGNQEYLLYIASGGTPASIDRLVGEVVC